MLSGKISKATTLCECPPGTGRYSQTTLPVSQPGCHQLISVTQYTCISVHLHICTYVHLYTTIQYLFIICVHCTLVLADILQMEYKGVWIELSRMTTAVSKKGMKNMYLSKLHQIIIKHFNDHKVRASLY